MQALQNKQSINNTHLKTWNTYKVLKKTRIKQQVTKLTF